MSNSPWVPNCISPTNDAKSSKLLATTATPCKILLCAIPSHSGPLKIVILPQIKITSLQRNYQNKGYSMSSYDHWHTVLPHVHQLQNFSHLKLDFGKTTSPVDHWWSHFAQVFQLLFLWSQAPRISAPTGTLESTRSAYQMHGDLDAWHRFSKVIFELMGYFEISILKQKLNSNYLNSRKKNNWSPVFGTSWCLEDILAFRTCPAWRLR